MLRCVPISLGCLLFEIVAMKGCIDASYRYEGYSAYTMDELDG